MYKILVDGKLLYSTDSEDSKTIVLSPKATMETKSAGSLSFVIPPGNGMHGSIKKLKSTITVEQDGEEIFRGRVLDDEADFYKQKNVYCEGSKAYLQDSIQRAYTYSGTVHDLFKRYINNHNSQVDNSRKFTIGEITAVGSSKTVEVENKSYTDTASEIESKLIDAYGGYLRTRTANGKHYIDWVKKYGGTNSQKIEFAVNLLDLKDKADAGDVFTVLIPLGASEIDDEGNYTDPVNVASVNDGKDYIQDDDAVALYGKIWRTKTWNYEDDASKLLEKGREYLKTGVEIQTITLKAIDMHFVNGNAQSIRVGDDVRILSNPHGIDKTLICSKIDLDLLNPENTQYTFGEPPRTLTENVVKAEDDLGDLTGGRRGGGGRGGVQEELEELQRWARFFKDEHEGLIGMNAGEINNLTNRVHQAEVAIDGANAVINAHAEVLTKQGELISSAHVRIDGANAEIEARVEKNGVISAINMTPESITIQAKRVNLEAIETKITNLTTGITKAKLLATGTLEANSAILEALTLRDDYISKSQKTVATGVEYAGLDYTGGELKGVTVRLKTDEIYYLGW